jgi:hypothetical protein
VREHDVNMYRCFVNKRMCRRKSDTSIIRELGSEVQARDLIKNNRFFWQLEDVKLQMMQNMETIERPDECECVVILHQEEVCQRFLCLHLVE